jgi:hypothetical protein
MTKPDVLLIPVLLFTGVFSFEASTAWSQVPGEPSRPLVQINSEILTVKEFQEMTRQLPLILRATLDTEEGRRKALDWIVDSKLMLAEALEKGSRERA